MAPDDLIALDADFAAWAHDAQLPPDDTRSGGGGPEAGVAEAGGPEAGVAEAGGPGGDDWAVWLLLGGRGAGKTRAGAEWVRGLALGETPFAAAPVSPIALVGETFQDAREVMVEGVSGILSVHRHGRKSIDRPDWSPSRRRLEWPNGAVAQVFSAEDPDSLRGPQFAAAWADELAKWRYPDATWDMLQFGLRLGERPRQLVTTTPRPIPLVKRLLTPGTPGTVVTRIRTGENRANLAPSFLEAIVGRYRGTRLGRQELDAELIADRPDALFRRDMIEHGRVAAAPELQRIVVAVDPPAGSKAGGSRAGGSGGGAACGIVAVGTGPAPGAASGTASGTLYVLADSTVSGAKPAGWAHRAVALYHRLAADRLIAEANQGGDMVAAVIGEVDAGVPVKLVHARRGKWLRAEPVAALYEQGRVRHVGTLPELEDEMCDFGRIEENRAFQRPRLSTVFQFAFLRRSANAMTAALPLAFLSANLQYLSIMPSDIPIWS
ncbi:DNA-packaging protein [Microbaculum marinum]